MSSSSVLYTANPPPLQPTPLAHADLLRFAYDGVWMGARRSLDQFALDFAKHHASFGSRCKEHVSAGSFEAVLRHLQSCAGVPKAERTMLCDSTALLDLSRKLPTTGPTADCYRQLSFHVSHWCSKLNGCTLMPVDLSLWETHFLLRFLLLQGQRVAMMQRDGVVRLPYKSEIMLAADHASRLYMGERPDTEAHIERESKPVPVPQAAAEIERVVEPVVALPDEDLATDDAWGQQHTAGGEDALW